MSAIEEELRRIYRNDEPRGDESWLEDAPDYERAIWDRVPEDLRKLALFIGYDSGLPHDDIREIFGVYTLLEYNSEEGTFGQLRDIVEDYQYDQVLIIGDDTYLDVAGQIGEPGSIHQTIQYDLDGATFLAPSLLALLQSCGSYRD